MRIGVLSDTHVPDRTDELPAEIFDILRGVDLVFHAGDICDASVIEQLQTIAPVVAVRGNRDALSLPHLPQKVIIPVGRWRVGLIHGTRSRGQETADRFRYLGGDRRFPDQRRYVWQAFVNEGVDCIVFGHTHQPCCEFYNGVLLFNPGGVVRSPGGHPSCIGILTADETGLSGRMIPLAHPPRRYTLVEQTLIALQWRQRYGPKR